MEVNFNDFSSLLVLAFISLIVAIPVKVSASVVGAPNTSIVRSFMAMFVPLVIVVLLSNVFSAAILLYPIILFISIMKIVRVSFVSAFMISLISAAIYYVVITKFLSGITIA